MLGPYKDDKSYSVVSISDLREGINTNKLLPGKVLWSIQLDTTFPL